MVRHIGVLAAVTVRRLRSYLVQVCAPSHSAHKVIGCDIGCNEQELPQKAVSNVNETWWFIEESAAEACVAPTEW